MGRLSKEEKLKPLDPINEAMAEVFLEKIGKVYNDIKEACRINSKKRRLQWAEDVFHDSIIKCYDTISRNGLKDLSVDGCKNYLFNAYNMNRIFDLKQPYNSRKVDSEEIFLHWNPIDEQDGKEKVRKELFNDYSVMQILDIAEKGSDITSFYCFRLYYLMEKMSFRKLVKLTGIKNAKSRVKEVFEYVKNNIDEEQILIDFEEKFGNNLE